MGYAPQIMRDLYRGAFIANSAVQRAIRRLEIAQNHFRLGDQEQGISKIEEAFDLLCDAGADVEKLVKDAADLPSSFFGYVELTMKEATKKIAKDKRNMAKSA